MLVAGFLFGCMGAFVTLVVSILSYSAVVFATLFGMVFMERDTIRKQLGGHGACHLQRIGQSLNWRQRGNVHPQSSISNR